MSEAKIYAKKTTSIRTVQNPNSQDVIWEALISLEQVNKWKVDTDEANNEFNSTTSNEIGYKHSTITSYSIEELSKFKVDFFSDMPIMMFIDVQNALKYISRTD